jgi:predicted phosphodiesterase
MDQDKTDLALAAQHIGRPAPQHVARLTIDGYPIAVTHGHHGLERLISEQEYRYVMHGHTHARRDTVIGRTRVINPGALGGRKPAPRHIAVLDTASDDLRFIEVPE